MKRITIAVVLLLGMCTFAHLALADTIVSKSGKPQQPKEDPNNLFPADKANCDISHPGGKVIKGAGWDGSGAIQPRGGSPWFPIGGEEGKNIHDKLRGKWVKYYVDVKGRGSFRLALQDSKTRLWVYISQGARSGINNKGWTRLGDTAYCIPQELPAPTIYYKGGGKGALYDNFRIYILGTEPEELLLPLDETWHPGIMKNYVATPSFEGISTGAQLPPGWNLAKGGLRVVNTQAHSGKQSMMMMADSVAHGPDIEMSNDVMLRVHFWVKGKGSFSVGTTDLDEMGSGLASGVAGFSLWGRELAGKVPLTDKWVKIEVNSTSYEKNARGRRITLRTDKNTTLYVDDMQILRNMKVFPEREKPGNLFTGGFRSAEAGLEVTINEQPITEVAKKGIVGPSIILIKATPRQDARQVTIQGKLDFADGGSVAADSHWRYTTTKPSPKASKMSYQDSKWGKVKSAANGMTAMARQPVWFRRVVLWNVTSYLVPDLVELPTARGEVDWLTTSLNPPIPVKVESYEIVVDVPMACRLIKFKNNGAYFRSPQSIEEDEQRVTHGGQAHRRYRLSYRPEDVTGIPGAYRGKSAKVSMVLIKQVENLPDDSSVYLHRVANGNVVDLPTKVGLVNVPLDGTRPKKIIIHNLWTAPYAYGNPPNVTISLEATNEIMMSVLKSGMTHSGWPEDVEGYVKSPQGAQWVKLLRKYNIGLSPVYHNFPFSASHHRRFTPDKVTPTYEYARRTPNAVAWEAKQKLKDGSPDYIYISTGWLLTDASAKYWQILKQEHADHVQELESATGAKVTGFAWDYEFGIDSYDPITLKLFAKEEKIDEPLDEKLVRQKYSAEWNRFRRWLCRRLIDKTRKIIYDPLGLEFHVYYGEGRPFDAGGCHWISSWGVGQNVSGQIRSVRQEYETMTPGLKRDPDAIFLGMLQAEIQAVHRRRPFHWQELRNNIVKRAVSTRGGAILYTEVEPQCPALHYGVAAAARIIARREDYFIGPEAIFAGPELEKLVKLSAIPADLVLLKKGNKGLLLLFGGEPEAQKEPLKIQLTAASGMQKEITLAPMGLETIELKFP